MNNARLFCTFRVDGRLFGVDLLAVKEVTAETTYTPIAHAPDEVLGLVNIRGHIFLALDLRKLLAMPRAPMSPASRLVLFKATVGPAFGVVVDQISEIHSVIVNDQEFTRNSPELSATQIGRLDLIESLGKLADELLVVLNPRRFLAVVEQQLNALA